MVSNLISHDANILLTLVSQDFRLIRKGNYFSTEEHDSFIIDPSKALFFWNSRGINGDALTYLVQVRGLSYYDAIDTLSNTVGKFTYEIFEARKQTPNIATVGIFYRYGKDHRDYWYDVRGYTDETICRFKLGYTGKYWTIPIFVRGVFKNFQIRGVDTFGNKIVKNYYSGIGRLPFNFDNIPSNVDKTVYITESLVDAIMLMQNGHFAISHNAGSGGWDHEWSQLLMDRTDIRIVYDNDEAGKKGSTRTAKYLMHNSSILVWPDNAPHKYDITDLYKDGTSIEDLEDYFLPSYVLVK